MSMMMEKDREFMLPANMSFIIASLFVALLINWLPWHGVWLALRPDFLALVLLYWCTHKPHRIGIGFAWTAGILADVADASLFGQHALAYAILAFGGIVLHRRVQMFDLRQQTMQVFPLLLSSYVAYALAHWWIRGFIAWEYFLGCLTSTLLWPPLTLLLQSLRQKKGAHERL